MRESFEALKTQSIVHRLIYRVLKFGSGILPAGRRQRMKAALLRAVRYRPAYMRKEHLWGLNDIPRSPSVVVSLTSYPKRIGTVHRVIEALLAQNFKPDKIVLWLGEDRFPRKELDLPENLLRLKSFGLTIGWCKDVRSYTKLIPALKAYPNDIIVTVDDDTLYGNGVLKSLYDSYLRDPDSVHCNVVLKIGVGEDGCPLPYLKWQGSRDLGRKSVAQLLLGYGGVLYPPGFLCDEIFNEEAFLRLAPHADDLWFWAMTVKSGARIKLVEHPNIDFGCDYCADQGSALCNINMDGPVLNDQQFSAILAAYPEVKSRLLKAVAETKGILRKEGV